MGGRGIFGKRGVFPSTCSEDPASITAPIEFYRCRVFDGFKAEDRNERELEIGMRRGSVDFASFAEDVAAAERRDMYRIVWREMDGRAFRKTCRRRAKSRV